MASYALCGELTQLRVLFRFGDTYGIFLCRRESNIGDQVAWLSSVYFARTKRHALSRRLTRRVPSLGSYYLANIGAQSGEKRRG